MNVKLHHLNLCTRNVKEMDAFYKDVLDMEPDADMASRRVTQGYDGGVSFMTDGTTQVHLAQPDLDLAFRERQAINPLVRGHIAFRTDDMAAFKKRLEDKGVPYSDYGGWAIRGWHQIFFYDPDGNIIEVHEAREDDA